MTTTNLFLGLDVHTPVLEIHGTRLSAHSSLVRPGNTVNPVLTVCKSEDCSISVPWTGSTYSSP
jgi:hypothetical protein